MSVKDQRAPFREPDARLDSGQAFPPADSPRVQALIRWIAEVHREHWARRRQNTEEDGAA